MNRIDDALDSLSARELEQLEGRIQRRLTRCVIDPEHDGAVPVRVTYRLPGHSSTAASLRICPKCLERHRLPEGRAEDVA